MASKTHNRAGRSFQEHLPRKLPRSITLVHANWHKDRCREHVAAFGQQYQKARNSVLHCTFHVSFQDGRGRHCDAKAQGGPPSNVLVHSLRWRGDPPPLVFACCKNRAGCVAMCAGSHCLVMLMQSHLMPTRLAQTRKAIVYWRSLRNLPWSEEAVSLWSHTVTWP